MRHMIKSLLAGCALAVLSACAPLPQRVDVPVSLWRDQAFDYDPALVTVTKEQLFRLDPALLAQLHDPYLQSSKMERRMERLTDLLFDPRTRTFNYGPGQTNIASVTWSTKRGDCLSLTVLAFAIARELRLPAVMQEVPVPVLFDRHAGLDYVAGHVNVFIKDQIGEGMYVSTLLRPGTIIDFEPQIAALRLGQALTDDEVLARYYNNIGVEHLANGRHRQAYAFFRAAALADPGYAGPFNNLALLYQRAGLGGDAEQLLRHAMRLPSEHYLALRALHDLVVAQGRTREAAELKSQLVARQEKDPYYWTSLGAQRLRAADYRGAIDALEQAQKLAVGFAEIHHYLAMAYALSGRMALAQNQVATLTELNAKDPYLPALTNKMQRIAAGRL